MMMMMMMMDDDDDDDEREDSSLSPCVRCVDDLFFSLTLSLSRSRSIDPSISRDCVISHSWISRSLAGCVFVCWFHPPNG